MDGELALTRTATFGDALDGDGAGDVGTGGDFGGDLLGDFDGERE